MKENGMETAFIVNGSEKQNAWATDIVTGWMRAIDAEIEANEFRASDSKYYAIIAILKDYRDKAVARLATMTSKQVIDMYTSRNMLDTYVINMARKAVEAK
jgi:hypothetical protein